MPIYEFKCPSCSVVFDRVMGMNDKHEADCECGERANRVFSECTFTEVYNGRYEPGLRQYVGTKTERRRLMKEKGLVDYPYDE